MNCFWEDPVALWAEAQAVHLAGDYPAYGSPQWSALPPDSPARFAAVLEAAELWRRQVAEQARLDALLDTDPDRWFREVTADANEEARRTARRLRLSRSLSAAELAARRRPKPPHPVRATPGWPPVRIPGRPGWWRHCINGVQTDLPYRTAAPERRDAA
ncbi:hypothetical protein ACIQU6_02455 [Streptomyces sp. NPDC090442]|uniref:hypothetical protein n=1 Tax=Streptomyces sp. NPDC090442 TaxID=3365962 RepID=UPI0038273342